MSSSNPCLVEETSEYAPSRVQTQVGPDPEGSRPRGGGGVQTQTFENNYPAPPPPSGNVHVGEMPKGPDAINPV